MSTSIDTMKNFFNVLKLYANDTTADGVAVLDHAIRTVSHFAGLQDAVNHFLYDIANVTATTGNPFQSLYQNCGIALGADHDFSVDTGAVSGYNAGMGVVKNAQDIVPEDNVILSELPLPAAGSTTTHTYTGADGNTFTYTVNYPSSILEVVDFDDSFNTTYLRAGEAYTIPGDNEGTYTRYGEEIAPAIVTMTTGLENFWIDEGLKLAYDSFGLDFDGKSLTIQFGINEDYQALTAPIVGDGDTDAPLPFDNLKIMLNSVMYTPIDADDSNGNTRIDGGNNQLYFDRTIAHELVHALMFATGTDKPNMPQFFTEGVAELIHGSDDYDNNYRPLLVELALEPDSLTEAMSLEKGTGNVYSYAAGYMFLRYLLHQSLPTQVVIGTGAAPELFAYTGGEEIISGAANGSQVNLSSNIGFLATSASGDDLFVSTTTGNLIVRDARGKLLNFGTESGTVVSRAYMAAEAGTVDGRGLSGYEFIAGADNVDNSIIAGDGGCQLWGGTNGNDELLGGNGADNFVAGVACGNDNIFNAASNDIINLAATTLEQISSINLSGGGIESNVHMGFTDGSSLTVWSFPGRTLNFSLADGSAYSFDTTSTQWTKTN